MKGDKMKTIIDIHINEKVVSREEIAEIEELYKNGMPLTESDIKKIISYLCYMVRKKISDYDGMNIQEDLLKNKCDLAQSMIVYYLAELGVSVTPVNTNEVIKSTCGHSLVLATFHTDEGEVQYLLDPTYIQFFSKKDFEAKKYTIINNMVCISPEPGFFILLNHNEQKIMPLLETL